MKKSTSIPTAIITGKTGRAITEEKSVHYFFSVMFGYIGT